ncbi:hypothetical protein [Dactylosporangium sp. CA-139066]|uniref:hypothetical protein n=1 Tax=Dactylosporangium sp. CA-139066 TaxID=3239930 RepID=UPI003D90E82C
MNAEPCRHCGRTSHGFACCGLIFADEPGGCPTDHSADLGAKPHRAPVKGQSGPARPLRAPRRIEPRGHR